MSESWMAVFGKWLDLRIPPVRMKINRKLDDIEKLTVSQTRLSAHIQEFAEAARTNNTRANTYIMAFLAHETAGLAVQIVDKEWEVAALKLEVVSAKALKFYVAPCCK